MPVKNELHAGALKWHATVAIIAVIADVSTTICWCLRIDSGAHIHTFIHTSSNLAIDRTGKEGACSVHSQLAICAYLYTQGTEQHISWCFHHRINNTHRCAQLYVLDAFGANGAFVSSPKMKMSPADVATRTASSSLS